jgi:hypothetical protein
MVEEIFRRAEVRRFYGNPPWSTFYDRIKKGLIPSPDVELAPDTPGWSGGLLQRHQTALRERGASRKRGVKPKRGAGAETNQTL